MNSNFNMYVLNGKNIITNQSIAHAFFSFMFTKIYQNNDKKNMISSLFFFTKVILQILEFYTTPLSRVSYLRLLCTLAGLSPFG